MRHAPGWGIDVSFGLDHDSTMRALLVFLVSLVALVAVSPADATVRKATPAEKTAMSITWAKYVQSRGFTRPWLRRIRVSDHGPGHVYAAAEGRARSATGGSLDRPRVVFRIRHRGGMVSARIVALGTHPDTGCELWEGFTYELWGGGSCAH